MAGRWPAEGQESFKIAVTFVEMVVELMQHETREMNFFGKTKSPEHLQYETPNPFVRKPSPCLGT